MPEHCPFCATNWENLDIVERWMPSGPAGSVAVVRPLNPVTDGHVLVVHREHDQNAAASFEATRRASVLVAIAAEYVNLRGLQANIITSIGPDATQTVFHTHVHVVPRRPGDGLTLPWTGQKKAGGRQVSDVAERAKAALDDTRCTDTMMDFFQVGLVRELVAEVERLRTIIIDREIADYKQENGLK